MCVYIYIFFLREALASSIKFPLLFLCFEFPIHFHDIKFIAHGYVSMTGTYKWFSIN